ncbi:GntR family transcriptional regulator [Lederbergia lenta]|uniref:GntR family transcriptional regulator n=1 Tax=Lederbergia lenta TaxID=1467 RepID=A0A2X4Z6B0_LEDLE|nr:GntR family transcriptional regulator [Lederbergia lenta]MCM3109780.1 GntR family transcriptional regulator [Lederbergia lenta]MEC2324470.1 GntR family transcriptional regulator [Lederbergia lenta]SQI59805.1 GntR family transcriptional regulator [Lederbergia lenta]
MARIETSLLTQQVYEVLRGKIIGREYTPGNKLDIHKLADEFGVSRSPVKDAINQLVHDGLIEIIPRKGTYVTELNFTEFIELLDARLMIEVWAAQQIMDSVSADKVEEWGQIVQEMDALLKVSPFPFEMYSKLDMEFHTTLIEWSANKKIKEIYSSLNTHVSLSRIVHSTSLKSTIKRHKDHWLLYEAMKHHDLPTFLGTLTLHIESLKKEAKLQWDEVMK